MSIFNYTLPSGSTFRLSAPTGTTQLQADLIFYGQVAAGALVGYSPGQTLTSTETTITKFALSRLDRGTAGVDNQAILALHATLVSNLPSVAGIPPLINTPLTNPINQANLVNINSELPIAAIGPLSSIQVQGILAQIANLVDQPADTMSNDKGVGQYGLSCVQLEQAGYVKPNTWKRFIWDPAPLTDVLRSPGVWTGRDGVTSAAQFLANPRTQTRTMTSLLQDGYSGLVSNGVIFPSPTRAVTASVGQVFVQNRLTSELTNTAVGDVGALVTNAGRFGTAAAAAWSETGVFSESRGGLQNVLGATQTAGTAYETLNVASRVLQQGVSGSVRQVINTNNAQLFPSLSKVSGSLNTTVGNIGQSVSSLTTNLDITGKAGQFATAFSNPTSAITNLANTDVGALATGALTNATAATTAALTNATAAATGALNSATAAATSAVTNATAAATSAVNNAIDSVNNQITNVTDKLGSLSNLSLDSLTNIFGGGAGDLVAKVQTAAGFTNTTNRGTLDVAFVKILGSSKIPVPSFEAPSADSLSLSSLADISSASTILQNLKSQGGALLSQVTQAQNTVTGLSNQAGGVISNALNQAEPLNSLRSVQRLASGIPNRLASSIRGG